MADKVIQEVGITKYLGLTILMTALVGMHILTIFPKKLILAFSPKFELTEYVT